MDKNSILTMFSLLGDPRTRVLGENVVGPCPFAPHTSKHKNPIDRNPGFSVKVEPNGDSVAYCHSCKVGGPIVRLLRKLNDLSGGAHEEVLKFVESGEDVPLSAVIERLERKQAEIDTDKTKKTRFTREGMVAFCRASARRPPTAYLNKRGLSNTTIAAWSLGEDVLGGDRVTIPIFGPSRYGRIPEIVGVQGRALRPEVEPKYRFYNKEFPFDPNTLIYGEHLLDLAWHSIILVEGPFDVIHLVTLGFRNVVCCFGTGAISGERLKRFVKWDLPVIILFDRDAGGETGKEKVATSLDGYVPRVYATTLPAHIQDPSDGDAGEIEWALRGKQLFVG